MLPPGLLGAARPEWMSCPPGDTLGPALTAERCGGGPAAPDDAEDAEDGPDEPDWATA